MTPNTLSPRASTAPAANATDGPLAGRTAVVTGAGGGLGGAIARRLAEAGAHISCGDLDGESALRTTRQISEAGGVATGFTVNVTDEDRVCQWRDEVVAEHGPASILVNVAGAIERRLLLECDHETFMRAVDINLGGTYTTIRAFAPDLIAAGNGRVVNIASVAGITGYPFPSYAASKAAVVNLSRSLLTDFWGTGVTVNSICPGAMDTAMFNTDLIPEMTSRTPLGRIVTVDEVAAVAEFLCLDIAAGVNGTAITVDGGATAVIKYFNHH